ncbi:hypothetical protein [Rhizobium sp. RAF56]|uniref:hypothetical protein n=1 Tax=Rhizobium sp. RAF56 TaxID=3233062 RepID=UPI003F9D4D57
MIGLHTQLPFAHFSPFGTALLASSQFQTELATRLQLESMRFVHDRLKRGLQCMEALSAVQAHGDMLAVLSDFSEEVILDYIHETGRVFAIVATSATDAETVAGKEAKLVADDFAACTIAP